MKLKLLFPNIGTIFVVFFTVAYISRLLYLIMKLKMFWERTDKIEQNTER